MTTPTLHERLADDVHHALTTAGYTHAPERSGRDGFEVWRPRDRGVPYVLVTLQLEGHLAHMGTPGVRRSWMTQLAETLRKAGFVAEVQQQGGVPLAVSVERGEPGEGETR